MALPTKEEALKVKCPFCESAPGVECFSTITSQPLPSLWWRGSMHDSRYVAAKGNKR